MKKKKKILMDGWVVHILILVIFGKLVMCKEKMTLNGWIMDSGTHLSPKFFLIPEYMYILLLVKFHQLCMHKCQDTC